MLPKKSLINFIEEIITKSIHLPFFSLNIKILCKRLVKNPEYQTLIQYYDNIISNIN